MINVTVIICTWNRARRLDTTLGEMRKLRVPSQVEWELLVVNNNSIDDTEAVVAKHANVLPIRSLFEAKLGLSNARNCALGAAQGDLVIWTDDDVYVDRDWLAAYWRAASRWHNAVYFGGLISPRYAQQPPAYLTENLETLQGLLGIRDFGPTERLFAPGELPFAANMAFKRPVSAPMI